MLLAPAVVRLEVVLVSTSFVGSLHVAETLDEFLLEVLVPDHVEHEVAATRAGRGRRRNIEAHVLLIARPLVSGADARRRRNSIKQVLHGSSLVILEQASVIVIPRAAHGTTLRSSYIPIVDK